jgi:hypothetical protein
MSIRIAFSFIMIFMLSVFFACKHEIPTLPPPTEPTVCFEEDVLPIFQSNCAKSNCHDAITKESGHQLDSYANIMSHGIIGSDTTNSEIYSLITDVHDDIRMPKFPNNPLTDTQIYLIKTWIMEGAQNTTNCSSCDSSKFSFAADVQPILEIHCIGCHSGLALDGNLIPLEMYEGVLEQVNSGAILPAITHTGPIHMPLNGNKLNDCNIAVIRKWIEAGAPKN